MTVDASTVRDLPDALHDEGLFGARLAGRRSAGSSTTTGPHAHGCFNRVTTILGGSLRRNTIERTIRRLFVSSFAAAVGALVAVSSTGGVDRGYLREIIVISTVWMTLIVAGPLVAVVLRRAVVQSPPRAVPPKIARDGLRRGHGTRASRTRAAPAPAHQQGRCPAAASTVNHDVANAR